MYFLILDIKHVFKEYISQWNNDSIEMGDLNCIQE